MSENEGTREQVPKDDATNVLRERRPQQITDDMTTKEAYFASLEQWAKQSALIQTFPNYLLANYNTPPFLPPQFPLSFPAVPVPLANVDQQQTYRQFQQQQQQPQPNLADQQAAPVGIPRGPLTIFRVLNDAAQQEIIQRVGGTEVIVAPFWKRAIAEAIDIFILLIVKIIVTFALFHIFDLDFDKDVMRKTLEDEDIIVGVFDISFDFLTRSSDLLLIELITKLLVCLYECLWTSLNNGATPGKSLMKIRIIYVEALVPLQVQVRPRILQQQRTQLRALVYPADIPGMLRSLMRALAKNLAMTLLFPISFVMIFFKNNRTVYDIVSRTLVVESNTIPVPAAPGVQMPQPRPHQQ